MKIFSTLTLCTFLVTSSAQRGGGRGGGPGNGGRGGNNNGGNNNGGDIVGGINNGGDGNDGDGNDGDGGNNNVIPPTNTFADASLNGAEAMIRGIINNQNGNVAAAFLRMGFHDCVGTGGCNGCINIENNIENRGLEQALNLIEPVAAIWQSATVSRADIMALAALVAADESQNTVDFLQGFEPGRVNCEDAGDCAGDSEFCFRNGPDVQADFPSADFTTHELTTWFSDNFQFSIDQTVAIMGVHTMGDANPQNSGFEGQGGWVNDEDSLDNEYYQQIVGDGDPFGDFEELVDAPNWIQIQVQNGGFPVRSQWVRTGGGGNNRRDLQRGNGGNGNGGGGGGGGRLFMMNADIALVRDLTGEFDDVNGGVSCTFRFPELDRCPLALSTLSKAAEYRNDNTMWLNDFYVAFTKMLSKGVLF